MVLGAPPLAERGMGEGRRQVKWLPYNRFSFISRLSRAEALRVMATHVEPEKWFRFGGPADDRRFEGTITGDRIHMRRIIGYRNSFLPVIDMDIVGVGANAEVRVTMRPFVVVYVFGALWFSVIGGGLLGAGNQMWWISAPLLLFFYAMVMGGFWFEAAKQERTLRAILQEKANQPSVVS